MTRAVRAPRVAQVRRPVDRLAADLRARRADGAAEEPAAERLRARLRAARVRIGRRAGLVVGGIHVAGQGERRPPLYAHLGADEVRDQRAAGEQPRGALEVVLDVDAGLDLVRAEQLAALGDPEARGAAILGVVAEPAGATDLVAAAAERAVHDQRVRIVRAAVGAAKGRPRGLVAEAAERAEVGVVELLRRLGVERGIERAAVERRAVPRDERLDLGRAPAELRGPPRGGVGRQARRVAAGGRVAVELRRVARGRQRDQAHLDLLGRRRRDVDLRERSRPTRLVAERVSCATVSVRKKPVEGSTSGTPSWFAGSQLDSLPFGSSTWQSVWRLIVRV